jgi:hypothetical protein
MMQINNLSDKNVDASSINPADGCNIDHSSSLSEDEWDNVDFECDRVSLNDSSGSDIDAMAEI